MGWKGWTGEADRAELECVAPVLLPVPPLLPVLPSEHAEPEGDTPF